MENQKKILCIEDELFIASLYSRALTRAGYKVTIEQDGQKGLALAQTDNFDIILLDLMLPTLTGTEILRALRDHAKTPKLHAKIIVTTNLEEQGKAREEIERMADAYLVKAAITPRQLVDFLDRISINPHNSETGQAN